MTTPNSGFVFNLGRLWQSVISERWDEASSLYKLIKEIMPSTPLKKYSKMLKKLKFAIQKEDSRKVDEVLFTLLEW